MYNIFILTITSSKFSSRYILKYKVTYIRSQHLYSIGLQIYINILIGEYIKLQHLTKYKLSEQFNEFRCAKRQRKV